MKKQVPGGLIDYDAFSRTVLKIKDKQSSEMVYLIPNKGQKKIRACKANRKCILKGRQVGSSTDTLGDYFHGTITDRNQAAMTIAHETGVTEDLLMKVRLFYENMPEVMRPKLEYASKSEFYWPALNSSFRLGTAGGKSVGVGRTINRLHCSEFSKWIDAKEIFLQAVASVPDNGYVTVESTAEGAGNYFHELWKQSVWNQQRGVVNPKVFVPIFISWMDDPTCAMALHEGEDLDSYYPISRELLEYEDRLKLTPEQRKWHRITRDQFKELFPQEYPSTPDEAFLANERCYFNTISINKYRKNVLKPYMQGRFSKDGKIIPDPEGALSVWKVPQNDRPYVVFGDVAEGLEHGDWSCAYVYSPWDKDFVACWRGHIDPDLYADELAMLGRYYTGLDNRVALVGVESNNHGILTVVSLRRRLNYPRVYMQKFFNKRDKVETEKLGWRTDITTKRYMLDMLGAEVRDGTVGIYDEGLLDELGTFLRDERGLGSAEPPNHDDRVMSAAGCLVISQDVPRKPPTPEERIGFVPGMGMKFVNDAWEKWDKSRREKEFVIGKDAFDY